MVIGTTKAQHHLLYCDLSPVLLVGPPMSKVTRCISLNKLNQMTKNRDNTGITCHQQMVLYKFRLFAQVKIKSRENSWWPSNDALDNAMDTILV